MPDFGLGFFFLLKPSLLIPLDQKQLLEGIPARSGSPA